MNMPQPSGRAEGSFHILINAGSGSAARLGAQAFQDMADKTVLKVESFSLLPHDMFAEKLEKLARSDVPVLVGGGDGSIAQAAALHLKLEKPFGIIPMGTMNLLAKDLGIPLVTQEANIFDLYRQTRIQPIDVGMANDQPFLCAAAVGTIPKAALYRENLRQLPDLVMMPRLTAFLLDQLHTARMRRLQLVADGKEMSIETSALVISNNSFALSGDAPHKLARTSLQDGALGIYSAAPQTLAERIRLLLRLHQGKLEVEPSVQSFQATSVFVKTGKSRELVSIDGEPMLMETPLSFRVLNGALKIIVPASDTLPS